ncbi:MAG: 23S rRNA (pseudouridine(1915)-N(3))-methyltransferase RlmH [Clostridia bacterium]|jgi:23S rRNA (pseudouridine1915-N3)-methyltransferase|nr:23S rRNA (pseudouridine(1915)-N(3))-methyltransferase RlmH [Clostridia bacterium]NLS84806.1 23S rRNA (pseudouridine(1915)-N(3))-methyltransferase RlmH [Oscillospiraceae bacterium]
MQGITIIALGKLNADYFKKAAAEYQKRLSAFCKLKIIELPEEKMGDEMVDKALEKEAKAILNALPKQCTAVAMCIEGAQMTSEQLAQLFCEKANSGSGDIAFIIGSSHGLAPIVKQAAQLKMSMSKMTFPHQLARVMLLEQVYRAFTINAGVKYHK